MKTELLAPAKNIEIAKAAIDAGADAVYIGAYDFGARQNAGNSVDDIKKLVDYAHIFFAKVMVTVNTIIKDEEIPVVKELIKNLYNIGVDSIIVQDMAILKWAIEGDIPPIPLHISTQCNNRTEGKVNFFNRMGLSRVVLARELSVNQIKDIIDKNPEIEIETFMHGALCVSYSGQCYLSQFIGGRSANRGECAQPCRKKYSVIDEKGKYLVKNKHVLSLKDYCTTNYLKELVDIGVKSFKIEGRLKDINYVKNVVGFYRQELDKYSTKASSGKIDLGFVPDLTKTFNRGYTSYFLNSREECFNFDSPKFIGEYIGTVCEVNDKYFKIRLNDGVVLHNQDGLVFDKTGETGCLVNKIDKDLIYPNKMPDIKCGVNVYRNSDVAFEKKLSSAAPKRQIGVKIMFNNGIISATDEDENEVSILVSEKEPANNIDKMKENFIKSMNKTGNSYFYIKDICINSILPFIPISVVNEYRRLLFEKLIKERLKNYKHEQQKPLKYVDYTQKEIDYRGNVYNKDAEDFYNKCGVDVKEYAYEKAKPKREVEIMRTKHCIKYALNMCKSPANLYLIDEKGERYKLNFDCKNCEMVILK